MITDSSSQPPRSSAKTEDGAAASRATSDAAQESSQQKRSSQKLEPSDVTPKAEKKEGRKSRDLEAPVVLASVPKDPTPPKDGSPSKATDTVERPEPPEKADTLVG